MARQIEQRRSDRARGADYEDSYSARQAAVAGEHLVGGEIGQRDGHRLDRIDTIGNRHEKPRRADGILCVSADDTEISYQLSRELSGHAWAGLLDDADKVVTRDEWKWPLEVWVAAAPDEGIGKPGAGSEYLDADLARAGQWDCRLFRQF